MLKKASSIIGLPIFTIREGRRIKKIEEVIYHPKQNKIVALLVDSGGWFSEPQFILFEDIAILGEDAVFVESTTVVKKSGQVQKDIDAIAKSEIYLTNSRILTEKGEELGKVSDIYFNISTGLVEEFEVSTSNGKNMPAKRRIKISDIITIGQDATIVRTYADDTHYEQTTETEFPQAQQAAGTTNGTSSTAEEQKPGETGGEEVQVNNATEEGATEQMKIKSTLAKKKAIERHKKDVVGLYLMKNILTPDDKLLAKEGDMVTYKLLDLAEEAGVLEQVFNNVTQRFPLTA